MSVADFLREADRLRKLEMKHEKETSRSFYSRKHLNVFEEIHTNLSDELKADIMKVQEELQKIRKCVYRFQAQLTDVKPSPGLIDRIIVTMADIEDSINIFKDMQHQRFEELLKEEKIFWQEISAFEQKIDVWSLPVKADGSVPRSVRICADAKDSRNLPAEVMALETFLQRSGGPHGGWDKYDHQNFRKVWTKHNGKPSYRKEAKVYLSDKTEEDIRLHEEWFLELCHLQEQKREAIHKWTTDKRRRHELQREQRERETLRKEPDEVAATVALRLMQEEQRREASEQLEVWRSCRKQQLKQEQEQRVRDEIRRRKRAKEERRRQLELKLMVESHVQQKKEEEELQVLQKEAQLQVEREERHRLAAEGIKHFQNRDSHRLEVKLQEKKSKEQEEYKRQRNLDKLKEKVQIHIGRDPTRLWKATKGWEAHIKEIGPSGGGPVFQMFHRAVPTWRQDL